MVSDVEPSSSVVPRSTRPSVGAIPRLPQGREIDCGESLRSTFSYLVQQILYRDEPIKIITFDRHTE